jgi:hypothetical protein
MWRRVPMCRLLGNTNNGTAAAGHLLAVAQPRMCLHRPNTFHMSNPDTLIDQSHH